MTAQENIVGENLAKARKRKDLSQAQLAEQVFVSAQAVGKWERGESLPDLLTLSRVAEILGVDLNYFLSGDAEGSASEVSGYLIAETAPTSTPNVHSGLVDSKPVWNLSEGNWNGVDFSALENAGQSFSSSNVLNSNFSRSKFGGMSLERNNVYGCDFSDADFAGSRIAKSYYSKDIFVGCSLQGLQAKDSYFSECDFSQADLTRASFESGGMEHCKLATATLNCSVFKWMRLAECSFSGDIQNCVFDNCKFSNVRFQDVVFTETFFKCRSLKYIQFIDCYADRLSYEALRNAGANMEGLKLR